MKPMNKGGKNETMALCMLTENVRKLIYGRTDAERGDDWGKTKGGAQSKG